VQPLLPTFVQATVVAPSAPAGDEKSLVQLSKTYQPNHTPAEHPLQAALAFEQVPELLPPLAPRHCQVRVSPQPASTPLAGVPALHAHATPLLQLPLTGQAALGVEQLALLPPLLPLQVQGWLLLQSVRTEIGACTTTKTMVYTYEAPGGVRYSVCTIPREHAVKWTR